MKFGMVFPGQGSQSVGMMLAYGESKQIRATFDEASQALGRDLWQLMLDGPSELLSQTVNTQPLMLTAGVAVFRRWRELGGGLPELAAGHSLGEYSALVAAEALRLDDAVRLVELRAKAMQAAVPAGQGGMAAILGLEAHAVVSLCADAAEGEVVQAVNFNDPKQTVIAGHTQAVERACALAKARGAKRALPLPVSAPFHSILLQPASEALAAALPAVELRVPRFAVVNNVDVAIETDPVRIRDALIRQAAAPVRWVETMAAFEHAGISHVVECGPGKVLAGLAKRCSDSLSGVALVDHDGLVAAASGAV